MKERGREGLEGEDACRERILEGRHGNWIQKEWRRAKEWLEENWPSFLSPVNLLPASLANGIPTSLGWPTLISFSIGANCSHSRLTYKSDGPCDCCSWDGGAEIHVAPINEAMRESTASKCLKGAVGYSHWQLRYAPQLVSRLMCGWGGGRNNKKNIWESMVRIQHDHVVSEFH